MHSDPSGRATQSSCEADQVIRPRFEFKVVESDQECCIVARHTEVAATVTIYLSEKRIRDAGELDCVQSSNQ